MTQEIRTLAIVVVDEGKEIFDESATHIKIEDEAAGEFLIISQPGSERQDGLNAIAIDPSQWPMLRDAIDRMVKECRT